MTMCPLIQSLQLEEQYQNTQDSIISYAQWFDNHTQPILQKIREDKLSEIEGVTDSEFYYFMVEATRRKVSMLQFLKVAIESRKDE